MNTIEQTNRGEISIKLYISKLEEWTKWKNRAQCIRIAVDGQTLINSAWKKHLTDSMVVLMTGFMNWISIRTDCQTCESQYPMEDDQARIHSYTAQNNQSERVWGLTQHVLHCLEHSTSRQGWRKKSNSLDRSSNDDGRCRKQQGEQRKLLLFCQKVQEKVMQIPIICVEEQTSWECL